MRVLDLFSGIGGFSLGLERAGFRTVAFCEIEPYCRAVLARHWPGVPVYGDIRELDARRIMADAELRHIAAQGEICAGGQEFGAFGIDIICGGFPCQDISVAGKGAGLAGERSGLWREYHRLIRELRPRYVIVENVAALLSRGLGEVLGDLAEIGYDAEWHCIPASYVGAPHRRDRVWIIAYADVADTNDTRLEGRLAASLRQCASQQFTWSGGFQGWDEAKWFAKSGMGRVSNGVPARVDRLKALGNAVVPQIPEIIGRAIMRLENAA